MQQYGLTQRRMREASQAGVVGILAHDLTNLAQGRSSRHLRTHLDSVRGLLAEQIKALAEPAGNDVLATTLLAEALCRYASLTAPDAGIAWLRRVDDRLGNLGNATSGELKELASILRAAKYDMERRITM